MSLGICFQQEHSHRAQIYTTLYTQMDTQIQAVPKASSCSCLWLYMDMCLCVHIYVHTHICVIYVYTYICTWWISLAAEFTLSALESQSLQFLVPRHTSYEGCSPAPVLVQIVAHTRTKTHTSRYPSHLLDLMTPQKLSETPLVALIASFCGGVTLRDT